MGVTFTRDFENMEMKEQISDQFTYLNTLFTIRTDLWPSDNQIKMREQS